MDNILALAKKYSLFDRRFLWFAIVASFKKLSPVSLLKNPVMFVCEMGAIITTIAIMTATSALASSEVPTATTMTIHGPTLGPTSRIVTCAASTSTTTGCCAATATERPGATRTIANTASQRCRRGAAGIKFCK